MSTEDNIQPRSDIAASSLRALRAARRTTPEVEPEPVAEVTDLHEVTEADTADDSTVTAVSADGVPAEAEADHDAETDAAETDDVDDREADADTDTDAASTDDEPPVLASASARRATREASARETTPARERARPSRVTTVSAALAAAALVFGVVSGVVWWRADHDPQRAAATARDDVAVDARLAIATVNTSDYRKPDVALRNWLAVSAGSLKSQFTDQRKAATTLLGQSKVITSAVVLDAAVTKLDTAKGSATVIASVNLKRKPITGAATTTRNRFRATLTRHGGDWKLADLALVPVQLT